MPGSPRLTGNQRFVLQFLRTRHPEEVAGVDIAEAHGRIASSSIYAALAALRKYDLIDDRWDTSGPRPLRLFRLTHRGWGTLEDSPDFPTSSVVTATPNQLAGGKV
jgi:DNA-binding PadR family transcriptional regulator